MQYIEIGRRIKTRRNELKISQSELAEIINISTNHMSSIENGKSRPSLGTFLNICIALKTHPDYFVLGLTHANNPGADFSDAVKLCTKEDIELIKGIIELLVSRNKKG